METYNHILAPCLKAKQKVNLKVNPEVHEFLKMEPENVDTTQDLKSLVLEQIKSLNEQDAKYLSNFTCQVDFLNQKNSQQIYGSNESIVLKNKVKRENLAKNYFITPDIPLLEEFQKHTGPTQEVSFDFYPKNMGLIRILSVQFETKRKGILAKIVKTRQNLK